MLARWRATILLAVLGIIASGVARADDQPGTAWVNPWRKANGDLSERATPIGRAGPDPLAEYNRAGEDSRAMNDRGIDSADTKWRRQARLTGVRMRMLNGPQLAFAAEGYSSDTERGVRNRLGAVVPLNPRWELAALDRMGIYNLKDGDKRAGLEALTLRVGANPSVSFRPWFAMTPYVGLWDADGVGLGLSGGVEKSWPSGISLRGEAYAWEPWDEGYDTVVQDGRRHGFQVQGTLPIDRRLTLTGTAGYEWLELGPRAPGGSCYAGRRGNWSVRAQWIALRRDGAYMGYGFRDTSLWSEELVPVEFGFFGEVSGQRYHRPEGFNILNPTEKSLRERVGIVYNQAISPHLGFNSEAYVGQDPRRGMGFGELYGATFRMNLLVNVNLRLWFGWGYESESNNMESGGGPTSYYSFGLHWIF